MQANNISRIFDDMQKTVTSKKKVAKHKFIIFLNVFPICDVIVQPESRFQGNEGKKEELI